MHPRKCCVNPSECKASQNPLSKLLNQLQFFFLEDKKKKKKKLSTRMSGKFAFVTYNKEANFQIFNRIRFSTLEGNKWRYRHCCCEAAEPVKREQI